MFVVAMRYQRRQSDFERSVHHVTAILLRYARIAAAVSVRQKSGGIVRVAGGARER
jgi:hypothetical protein